MKNGRPIVKCAWIGLGALVGIIGCGGNGVPSTGPYVVPNDLAGNWVGTMNGGDGSATALNLTISPSGSISGSAQTGNGTGISFPETGTMQSSGSFAISGYSVSTMAGTLSISGTIAYLGSGTSTGAYTSEASGTGQETQGTTQISVTINLSSKNNLQ